MSWRAEVGLALGARVEAASAVAGGEINDAFRVALADGRVVFVKANAGMPRDLFAAEAAGLAWLAEAGALRVPTVLAVGDAWLALEWLETGARGVRFDEELGRGLAQLHRAGAPRFGLDRDNYIATIQQPGTRGSRDSGIPESWPEFWVEQRLRRVCARAATLRHAPPLDAALDALAARTEAFGPAEPPARLHGDLWWGNVVAVGGAPVVVDPAVYGGHREVDLAMLALFGELPDALIAAYAEVWPLAAGWRARLPLWQLYPLAVHAVLFGAGYGDRLARSLAALIR